MYDSSEPADNFAHKWKNIELTAAVQSPRQTFSGKLYLIFAYLTKSAKTATIYIAMVFL